MTDYMAQGLNLPPSSRQDIISALLDGYGNSFEGDDNSPYKLSPVSAFKALPPTPPSEMASEQNYSNRKPVPAAGYMNMQFQLRVNEPASPTSLNSPTKRLDGSPTRIVSKRLNRRLTPPSLSLVVSNGSTATLPSAPLVESPREAQIHPKTPAKEETSIAQAQIAPKTPAKDDKSLPPPPPEKHRSRGQRPQQPVMGLQNSKESPLRKDSHQSHQSQDGKKPTPVPVKRKPLAKFTSLAELGNGPRGGKGGPLPQPRARKQSMEEDKPAEKESLTATRIPVSARSSRENRPTATPQEVERATPRDIPQEINALPPTPKEASPLPPQPSKKPFNGMGLPSNPRHKKGKSSTGFDFLKSATSPVPQTTPSSTTALSPRPTSSSNNNPEQQMQQINVDQEQKLLGDAPTSSTIQNDQRRPFSFEPMRPAPTPPKSTNTAAPPRSFIPATSPSPPTMSTSPDIDAPAPQPPQAPAQQPAVSQPMPQEPLASAPRAPAPPAFASLPSQQRSSTASDSSYDASTPPTPDTPPPFVPLTETPAPTAAPSITHKHLTCYSQHATFVWSRNSFQPMGCMVCAKNDTERKWACVWCYLRICLDCSRALNATPGRNLQALLEARTRYAGEGYAAEEDMPPQQNGVAGSLDGSIDSKRQAGGTPELRIYDAEGARDGNDVDFS